MISSTRILTTQSTDPHKNLALEELLLRSLPSGQALLFLWQNKHTVVIGAGQNAWRECHTKRLEDEGGTLARRSSGGGAVYHDMGNLNFSFIVPREDYDVGRQLKVVLNAVRSLGVQAEATGRNDLTVDGRKFSGNAFRLLKNSALHHGTLLVSVDMDKIGRYLNVSSDKLRTKGVKSVPSRVVNLSDLADISIADMHAAMAGAFRAEYGPAIMENADEITFYELNALAARYSGWEWNYGASPSGELTLMRRFEWGGLELNVAVQGGKIDRLFVYTDSMDETLHERVRDALLHCEWRGEAVAARLRALGMEDVAGWVAEEI